MLVRYNAIFISDSQPFVLFEEDPPVLIRIVLQISSLSSQIVWQFPNASVITARASEALKTIRERANNAWSVTRLLPGFRFVPFVAYALSRRKSNESKHIVALPAS